MKKSQVKKIRAFAKRRFPDKSWKKMEAILRKQYESYSEEEKKQADREMDVYFEALEKGLVKKGESILGALRGKVKRHEPTEVV